MKSCDKQSHVPSPLVELLCGLGRQGSSEGAAWGCVCGWAAFGRPALCRPRADHTGMVMCLQKGDHPLYTPPEAFSFSFLLLPFFISLHIFSVSLPFSPPLNHETIFLTALHSLWDLSSPTAGIEPTAPAVEAWSLNCWTAREVPHETLFP